MRFRTSLAAAAAAVLMAFPAVASAQATTATLPVGKWTGTVTPPGAETAVVTYDVAVKDSVYTIQLDAGVHGKYPTTEVEFKDGKLSFVFTPGPRLLCVLNKKEDQTYAGLCTDSSDDGRPAEIVMVPPKPADK